MKILLTGANGFLGKELQEGWKDNHEIVSLGRNKNSVIFCDLANNTPVIPPVNMVVHAAGKAHTVPKNTKEKEDFFKVNVTGTRHLLNALEDNQSLKKIVFISSVSVYGRIAGTDIKEDAPLLANDPYGKSKIDAERLIWEWCIQRNITYYILRLPLIAGKNAPGNLGAMANGIRSGRYFSIGKARAKKSMVLANDLAKFIADLEGPSGIYNLTDGYHPSFKELERVISIFYNKKFPFSLPTAAAKLLGFAGDVIGSKFPVNSGTIRKIMGTLTFDDNKARNKLNWKPREILKAWEIE